MKQKGDIIQPYKMCGSTERARLSLVHAALFIFFFFNIRQNAVEIYDGSMPTHKTGRKIVTTFWQTRCYDQQRLGTDKCMGR